MEGDELTITTDVLGATFRSRWSEDGTTFSGGWRPDEDREAPGTCPTTSRARERPKASLGGASRDSAPVVAASTRRRSAAAPVGIASG